MRKLGVPCLAVTLAVLQIVACSPSEESRSACTRSGPRSSGSGDVENHFPVDPGATWIYETTELGSTPYPVTSRTRLAVTGTARMSGLDATEFTETPLGGTGAPPSRSFLAKGPSGVTFVGDDDPADPLGRQLVPYQLMYFPLKPGESFAQVDCQGIDFGQDLDDDARNEQLDMRTVVTVVGAETLDARVGQVEAVRIDTHLSMTLHTTRLGSFVSEGDLSEWYAPGVGLVRRTSRLEIAGDTSTETTELVAYSVGGERFPTPTPLALGVPMEDEVPASARRTYSVPVIPDTSYVLAAFGLETPTIVDAYQDLFATPVCTAMGLTSASECTSSSSSGALYLDVRTLDAAPARYVVLAAPAPAPPPYADESAAFPARTATAGQVGPRGTSWYVATGLTPGASVRLWLFGLTADADLHVYADQTRSFELGCTLMHFDSDARAETCTFVATGEAAYLSVTSGELERNGAGFLMLAWSG